MEEKICFYVWCDSKAPSKAYKGWEGAFDSGGREQRQCGTEAIAVNWPEDAKYAPSTRLVENPNVVFHGPRCECSIGTCHGKWYKRKCGKSPKIGLESAVFILFSHCYDHHNMTLRHDTTTRCYAMPPPSSTTISIH